ncbi:MAG: hypothetical protein AB2A00_09975 [Myxococcota bacterium]
MSWFPVRVACVGLLLAILAPVEAWSRQGSSATRTGLLYRTGQLAQAAPAPPDVTPNTSAGVTRSTDSAPVSAAPRRKRAPFSFGLQLGHPFGLQLGARWDRHSVVGSVAYDVLFGGVAAAVDYRFSYWTLEFIRHDLNLDLWIGVGGRVSFFDSRSLLLEQRKSWQRNLPVGLGLRTPFGATVRLPPLPLELGISVSPLGFDVHTVGLVLPTPRPEAALEARVLLPVEL